MTVWIPDHNCSGKVITQVGPRSYQVKTSFGVLRRNRRHLIPSPNEQLNDDECLDVFPELSNNDSVTTRAPQSSSQPTHDGTVYTRSGRASRPPKRYIPDSN